MTDGGAHRKGGAFYGCVRKYADGLIVSRPKA